jgi:hypothetical protein
MANDLLSTMLLSHLLNSARFPIGTTAVIVNGKSLINYIS